MGLGQKSDVIEPRYLVQLTSVFSDVRFSVADMRGHIGRRVCTRARSPKSSGIAGSDPFG